MRKSSFILILLSLIFLGVYFWLVTPIQTDLLIGPKFDWPDETANYFWIKNYTQTGQLVVPEPLNLVAENQIHPRSFNVRDDGSLVPGSFLGLILFYGTLAKIFGINSILYFTPILAILGVLAFYGIIKRIFAEKIALLASILLFFHPAWWYYSVTSMLPNVAFISCLLMSIYFLLKKQKLSLSSLLLSALFAGLAISIRPTEIVWLAIMYLIVLIYIKDKLSLTKLIVFLAITFLILLPSLYQQQIIYGDWLASGYNQLQENDLNSCPLCQTVRFLLLPFGFHPALAVYNFWTHYISRLWWLSLAAILGLVVFFTRPKGQKTKEFGYLLLSLFVFGWLVIYYGSWQFSDLLTVHLNTLGLSYVRYWLPLYILALPFIALGLLWLANFLRKHWQILAIIALLLLLFYQSADLVLKAKADSILPVRDRIVNYKQNAAAVFAQTESESVIITVRKDKLFFPERKVIHTFQALSLNKELVEILPKLVEVVPVYYYALGPEPTLELGNGLRLKLIKNVGSEILYRAY